MNDSDQRNKVVPVFTPHSTHPGSVISKTTRQPSRAGTDFEHAKARADKLLAQGIERRFTEVLDYVYVFSRAEIRRIDDRGEYLDLIFRMPFFFPEPSPDSGKWLRTASAQVELRRGFMRHLRKPEVVKELSDFLYTKLSQFLLELDGISKYGDGIQKHLRRIAQKKLAGRPSHPIEKNVAKRIRKEGVEIHKAIQDMQRMIERWKKTNPKIEDRAVRTNIGRRYPWMPFFNSIIPTLPCKPYFASKIEASYIVDEDGNPLPAKISEPDRWSTVDIAVKILQKKLFLETALQFSLRDVKRILTAAIRKSVN